MQIGWIGCGNMGGEMAKRLAREGFDLHVYNRTRAKAEAVASAGTVEVCDSPREVAEKSDIVFTSLTDDAAILDIAQRADGLLAGAHEGLILVDVSTIGPKASQRVKSVLADGGVRYLSAPVQGSMFIIAKGFLSVLCSGDKDVYDDALPALEALGKRATYYGPGDESRCVKISNNMLVTAYFTLTGEILAVGEALGLPWQQLCERISACPASSKMLQDHADDLATRTWQSKAALTSTALKDLSLACDMAYEQRLALPVTACVRSYDQFMHAHSDYTSYSSYGTVAMLEQVCGIQPGEQPSEEQAEQYYQMLEGALACMQAELFAEGCVLSESYGVAWDVVLGDLLDCFGASTLMKAHAEQLKAREFAAGALPAAEAAGALHDFLAAAKARGVFTPIAEAAAQRINELLGTDENADIFELVKFAEKQAGVE